MLTKNLGFFYTLFTTATPRIPRLCANFKKQKKHGQKSCIFDVHKTTKPAQRAGPLTLTTYTIHYFCTKCTLYCGFLSAPSDARTTLFAAVCTARVKLSWDRLGNFDLNLPLHESGCIGFKNTRTGDIRRALQISAFVHRQCHKYRTI